MGEFRALIADDDADICEIVLFTLEALGASVEIAADGNEAIASWLSNRHELVVLDWMMPGKTGLEVCTEIRARGGTDIRILVLTAKATVDDERDALDAGADAFVRKPFSPRHLGSVVVGLLGDGAGADPRP